MIDNELIALFRGILVSGLAARGLSDVQIAQAYQPIQEGTISGRSLYFFKAYDHGFGWLARSSKYDPMADVVKTTYQQEIESTFTIFALAKQDPSSLISLTASDIASTARMILQQDSALQTFLQNDVSIQRIENIRNNSFYDDYEQFEFNASFDFTLVHFQTDIVQVPSVATMTGNVYKV